MDVPIYPPFSMTLTGNKDRASETRDMTLEVAAHFYRHPMKRLPHLPQDRHDFIVYDQLTTEPKATVTALYAKLGFEMSPEYAQQLDTEQTKIRSYKSNHAYTLEDYDLTADGILQDFRDVFERFGFSEEYPA